MSSILKKRWEIDPVIPEYVSQAMGEDIHPVLKQMLYNRGIQDGPSAGLYLSSSGSLFDPFLMKDMSAAVERLWQAIDGNEGIAVYGDYDVDGVTATTLLVQVLRALGATAEGYIPNRFEEGYGLNNDALDGLVARGFKLVVSVDCGIRSPQEAAHARATGLDLIISDHHQPNPEYFPEAIAVICPRRAGDPYPDKNLAGVGLAFKIAEALVSTRPGCGVDVNDWLDLVAVGTVADMVPLVEENRSLVRAGLMRMRFGRRKGLASLMGVANIAVKTINAQDIGFAIGPRLNAAGRLESAMQAYELLISEDGAQTGMLAQKLDDQNHKRQELTRRLQADAEARYGEIQQDHIIISVLEDQESEELRGISGVVGLVAARLTDTFYRPSVVAVRGAEVTRASCRSIAEFNITAALDECGDLFVRYGGHAMAAGFTVLNENLPELERRLREIAARELSERELTPILHADLEITLRDLKPEILRYQEMIEPTGLGNRRVAFVSRNLQVRSPRLMGAEKQHMRMVVSDGQILYDAVAFRMAAWYDKLKQPIDLLYVYEKNTYNNNESLQLRVLDIKASSDVD